MDLSQVQEETSVLINSIEDGFTPVHPVKGLTVITAAIFVVGEMAGSGVLALPKAVLDAGWVGLVMILLCAVMSAYTGATLGRCWIILQDRFEKYREQTRYPYPAIGYEAFGNVGRLLVSFCVNASLFGAAIVYLLIASENIESILKGFNWHVSFCVLLPFIALFLWPITWLGTPKDFWLVGFIAMAATATACFCMFIQMLIDKGDHHKPDYPPSDFGRFFLSFGVIMFAFSGHPAFPTFQHDMKEPKKFSKSVIIGYSILFCIYFPVSAAGYFVYGDENEDNILNVISDSWLRTIALILVTVHLVMGFIIVINPFSQEIEDLLHIDKKFNWKRVINRTVVVATILFVAESIPQFGVILGLVGGSTVTLLTFVFPSLFYLKLCSAESPDGSYCKIALPLHQRVFHFEIILVGVIGIVSSTYSAIDAIVTGQSSFTVPCYVNQTAAHG
ncbi:Amino acid transporter AVT1A [Holothuria leucospilota]|uniref:Amino acid transporter AVT1A n=1 Tax=Holothuria leucospilota TaxID=206669 RepID=A0A9Q1BRC5_HOLLE|nr:Amino acid transporter AVT1A [Holothuria leucospilota]